MMEKGKREQRRTEEDALFNQMLIWLAVAVVLELIILLLKKAYVDMAFGTDLALAMMYFFQVFRYVGLVLIVGGVVWLILNLRGHRSHFAPAILIAASAVLWVISVLLYYGFDRGASILAYLPPAAAVLILIWFLYQRIFFFSALVTGCGAAALWLCRLYYDGHPVRVRIIFAAGFVLLGLAMLLAVKVKSSGGKVGPLRVLPEGAPYPVFYLTCAITAVLMALALLLGSAAAFYLMFVLIGWLFVQAVYFTVKLM